jgi:hypothetical protein
LEGLIRKSTKSCRAKNSIANAKLTGTVSALVGISWDEWIGVTSVVMDSFDSVGYIEENY